MVSAVFRYIGYSFAVAVTGVLILLVALSLLPESRQLTGVSLVLTGVSVILIYGSPVIVGYWFWRKKQKTKASLQVEEAALNSHCAEQDLMRRRFYERERLIDAVDEHRTALKRNLSRALRKNDYDAVIEDNRHSALLEFLASVNLDVNTIGVEEAIDVVSEQLAAYESQDREAGFDPKNLPFDGHAFESWVANALNAFGWEAAVTVASGDQGIDVIAKRGGRKLGIQCKLYSSSIGNKAVQEAHAGKAYYGVDRVAVLSNANFTTSAKELALATGVVLCSHHDIPRLYEKAFGDYR